MTPTLRGNLMTEPTGPIGAAGLALAGSRILCWKIRVWFLSSHLHADRRE